MKAVATLFLALVLSAVSAAAQNAAPTPHIDTVNVEGQKQSDPAPERHFAQSVLQPSTTDENQYAAWKAKICPQVIGLDPGAKVFVEDRIKQIATRVGAPVNRNDPCVTNIIIIFTDDPQQALNTIVQANRDLVMSHNVSAPKITQPVQSFYETLMRDDNGALYLDQDCSLQLTPHCPPWLAAHGSRLSWGIAPEMGVATVFVDAKTAIGHTLGGIADYLALMTLSQSHPDESCKQLASIANLLATNCPAGNKTDSISQTDIALLTGLYQSTSGPDQLQRQRLIGAMKASLKAQDQN